MPKVDDGGPAFPRPASEFTKNGTLPDGNDAIPEQDGLTLRDYMAAKAMQAEMITTFSDATPKAAQAFVEASTQAGRTPEDHLAFNAYRLADAMIRARRNTRTADSDMLVVCRAVLDEMEGMYDGAPDSKTLWMGEHIDRLTAVIAKAEAGK